MSIPHPKAVAGPVEMDAGLRAAGRDPGHPGAVWPASTQPTADGSRQGVTRRRLPSVHWSVARIESPWKGTEMSVPRNILRVVLLTAAAGLLAVAASVLREKKATVDLTTQQIEDAISALDPGVRAAVIGRLTADAVQQVKDHIDR